MQSELLSDNLSVEVTIVPAQLPRIQMQPLDTSKPSITEYIQFSSRIWSNADTLIKWQFVSNKPGPFS